jgi:hypothetical protein
MRTSIVLLTGAFLSVAPRGSLAGQAGTVSELRGHPLIVRNGESLAAQRGQALQEGDRIATDAASRLKARMIDETTISIGPKTALTLDRYAYSTADNSRTASLRAAFGVFRVWVTKAVRKNSTFEVITPTAVAGVRGTQFMGIVTDTTSAIASVVGRVSVRNANGEIGGGVTLLDGQGTDVGAGLTPTVPATWGNQRFYQLLQQTE